MSTSISPDKVTIGDFDDDFDDDILIASYNEVAILENQNGAFNLKQTINTTGWAPRQISIADLDGDTFKDIIYIGDEGSPLHSHIYQIWSSGKNKWNIRTLESNSSVKEIKGTLKDIVKYIETIEKERQEQFNKFQDPKKIPR